MRRCLKGLRRVPTVKDGFILGLPHGAAGRLFILVAPRLALCHLPRDSDCKRTRPVLSQNCHLAKVRRSRTLWRDLAFPYVATSSAHLLK